MTIPMTEDSEHIAPMWTHILNILDTAPPAVEEVVFHTRKSIRGVLCDFLPPISTIWADFERIDWDRLNGIFERMCNRKHHLREIVWCYPPQLFDNGFVLQVDERLSSELKGKVKHRRNNLYE